MIDVSDGFLGDLGHILESSGERDNPLGATIEVDALPASRALLAQPQTTGIECALAGGDDYELCFTAPADLRAAVLAAGETAAVPVTRVGTITATARIDLVDRYGRPFALPFAVH